MKAFGPILTLAREIAADHRGATAVEYALIIACVMLAIVAALSQIGVDLQAVFDRISTTLTDAI